MTKIEFVNHSSFIIRRGAVRLMCDPWLDGPVFDNGWDLLAETRLSYDDFRDITHIWFSHEHPDHFNPPNLKKIPKQYLADITILFQDTLDHRVAGFCKGLGFGNFVEMKRGVWLDLGEEIAVRCEPHDNGDSWLAVRTPEFSLLNLNDCVVTSTAECRAIARRVGAVDILATQFSYANRVGNPGDIRALTRAAIQKLSWVRTQVRAFRPRYVIPFASFSYFSHEDNWYLNEGVNRIDAATEFIRAETDATPIVLYPGDCWVPTADDPPDPVPAIDCYLRDYERAKRRGPLRVSRPVPVDTLIAHGNAFVERLRAVSGALVGLTLPSVSIFVEDHRQAFTLSPRGLRRTDRRRDGCDLECKSDALDYCFGVDWGGRTLDINGRFRVPPGGRYWKFKVYATLASFNSRNEGIRRVAATFRQRLLAWMRFNLTFRSQRAAGRREASSHSDGGIAKGPSSRHV